MNISNKLFMPVIIITITSCDYYNTAMEYKDNDALEKIVAWDAENTLTSNIFEYDGKCFMKKTEVWMLLNGASNPTIRTMSDQKKQCITNGEMQWISRICKDITDKDKKNLKTVMCIN
ncbi:hypothetical protein [Obesumbacterium proteus]|uniref:hypothetical protein n=1 Tax=Obesumbacterium proteus TaxID=82983 RepID=UPI00103444E3|nr:hypothetical protein [Obesumbacterium proteus]MCE9886067.1 hypothetical protein [Obesumbacterium proteus]MCE9917271.1 hypothetical protein [Obesumbacterium proteus]MCE9929936.1 hypothetical protein [Obesumbacterium proteus]MCG2878693.1 hypothetical protein [Obesumbacterium proteus]TBL49282.1 hypothetical protein EYY98_14130 [Obesumbacterium proteus]